MIDVHCHLNFKAFANETIPLFSSKASCEVVNAFFFDGIAQKNIELVIQAQIEYEHRNAFEGKTFETLYFEDFGTFEVTTEPRNYEMEKQVFLNLVFNSWVYFERDIYKPTYKIEVEKPNTLYVPTIEDRERLEQNTFGRKPTYKIDRRILKLTDIGQLKK